MNQQQIRNAIETGLKVLDRRKTNIPGNKVQGIADLKLLLLQLMSGKLVIATPPAPKGQTSHDDEADAGDAEA